MSDSILDAPVEATATAPGDLPLSEVLKRRRLLGTQFRHDNTMAPLGPQAGEAVTITATNGVAVPLHRAAVYYTTDGSEPNSAAATIPLTIADTIFEPGAGLVTVWQATLPPQPAGTVVRYRIGGWTGDEGDASPALYAHDGQGFWFNYGSDRDGITTFAYQVENDDRRHPAWLDDAVIYQIFLDRFHPGNDDGRFPEGLEPTELHGGTLDGVRRSLPYLADLGVTCLWLSPIGPADTYHRYDQTDYFGIDAGLGTEDDLRALTAAAHALGMRVLLDFVPSHCSFRHPAFLAAQADANAPTASWFVFDQWPDTYRCFLGIVTYLPTVNTVDRAARQHIIDSAVYWMEQGGIDGYRLDHAIGHGMDFWVAFRQALEAANPDVVTIGEVTDTADSLRRYRGRLTDVLDFPLAGALRFTFGTGEWPVSQFDTFVDSHNRFLADGPGRVSFLDNHDMDRFLFVAGGDVDRLKLAALVQFALPYPPTIYYGTEVGMGQAGSMNANGFGGDSIARQDMVWDEAAQNRELLAFYQSLITVRRAQPAVRTGVLRRLHLDDATGTAVYRLEAQADGDHDVILAFNNSATARRVPLPDGGATVLVATHPAVALAGGGVDLPPHSGAWLTQGE